LARQARLPAFVALYRVSDTPNPADPRWPDIREFRVRQLWPVTEDAWRIVSPAEWAHFLVTIRERSTSLLDRAEAQVDYSGLSTVKETWDLQPLVDGARQVELMLSAR
jgi:hypothetical protein